VLELLAGPYTVTDGEGTTITPSNGQKALYDDSLGLCVYNATLGGYSIAQLDGKTYLRGAMARANAFVIDLQNPGEYLIQDSLFSNKLYSFDKRAGTFGELLLSGPDSFVSGLMVRCPDRYLSVFSGNVLWKPLDASGSFATEATLTNAGSGDPTVSLARKDGVICIVYAGGQIVYYDTVAKAQASGRAVIGANQGAWYSRKHDIFVALNAGAIKVYANAVRPAVLANPVAVDALTKGRVSSVKVLLQGDSSDPCAGERIEWSLTGVGALALEQSVTDADGWAYNEYLAPVTSTGSATIQAQVQF
jgi:hypothetical protein